MFPGNTLSSTPAPSPYVGAGGNPSVTRTHAFEDGPIAEQDTSAGSRYQLWQAYIRGDSVWLEAANTPPRVVIPSLGVTDFDFAFSQNADLHYCYVKDGEGYLYWYDGSQQQFVTTALPAGCMTPRMTLDDKRESMSGTSDIVLCYIKNNGNFCHRLQRDRFQTEYVLSPGPFVSIERMYMSAGNRLQWTLVTGSTP